MLTLVQGFIYNRDCSFGAINVVVVGLTKVRTFLSFFNLGQHMYFSIGIPNNFPSNMPAICSAVNFIDKNIKKIDFKCSFPQVVLGNRCLVTDLDNDFKFSWSEDSITSSTVLSFFSIRIGSTLLYAWFFIFL
jgi:hypothetical protein